LAGVREVAVEPPRGAAVIPARGERIARTRAGITIAGTVHYSDQLQVLVKWDDGRSSSLRVDRDRFEIVGNKATRVVGSPRAADTDAPLSRDDSSTEDGAGGPVPGSRNVEARPEVA
jgi:hypothetical protein